MTIEERLKQLEARAGDNDELVRTLRDNFEVIAHLERRQSALLKEHSEWLVAHDREMAEFRDADRRLERRIADLGSA